MLQRVGFFDSPQTGDNRFDVLASALDRAIPGTGNGLSLVVLPELFNLTEPYYPQESAFRTIPPKFVSHKDSLSALEGLATAHKTIFICSLLADGFNAAYCVEPDLPPTLMCRKINDDGSNNYIATTMSDSCNPRYLGDTCVGALVCLDALECREEAPEARSRRQRLLAAIRASHQPQKLLCVPAHMASYCMPVAPGVTLILASSGGLSSFVRSADQTTLITREHARLSAVCLVDLGTR